MTLMVVQVAAAPDSAFDVRRRVPSFIPTHSRLESSAVVAM